MKKEVKNMNFEKINLVKLCMLIRRNVNTTEELNRVIHAVNMTAKRIRSMESAKAKISLAAYRHVPNFKLRTIH